VPNRCIVSKVWVVLSLLGMLFFAACEKRETVQNNSSGSRLSVVYIPKNTGNPYFNEIVAGFEEVCKQQGCEFSTIAPSTAEATSQIPILKEQIQRGVNIIAISPNSPDALNAVLDDARKAGIVVITVDADLAGNEAHRDASVLPTDFSKVGESQIELLGSQIGYQGEIAILSATRDAPNQNAWIAGMKDALAQPKYSKMKLVEIAYGDDEPQKSATEAEGLLTKHPNLRGIVSPTSVGLAAAAQALQIANKYPSVALTGLSTPNQMRKFVQDGVVKAFQLWSPREMGRLACSLAISIKQGKVKPGEGVEFELPEIGKRSFGKNNVVITGPLVTFDQNTINEYHF